MSEVNRPHGSRSIAASDADVARAAGVAACRVLWWTASAVVGLTGTLACIFFVPIGSWTLPTAMAGGAGYWVASLLAGRGQPTPMRTRLRAMAFGVVGGLTVTGVAGVAGASAAILPLLLLATSPMARRLWVRAQPSPSLRRPPDPRSGGQRGRTARTRAPGTVRQASPIEVMDLSAMSNAQLCRAWRTSFSALQRSEYADEREQLAAARASYLDELEHRDPEGFARWIADGARAASDPERYLHFTTGGNAEA